MTWVLQLQRFRSIPPTIGKSKSHFVEGSENAHSGICISSLNWQYLKVIRSGNIYSYAYARVTGKAISIFILPTVKRFENRKHNKPNLKSFTSLEKSGLTIDIILITVGKLFFSQLVIWSGVYYLNYMGYRLMPICSLKYGLQ